MSVLSKYGQSITIVDCEGLDVARPGGVIVAEGKENDYPQKRYSFPRLDSMPRRITIRWREIDLSEQGNTWSPFPDDLRQEVAIPENLLGAKGELRFLLDEKGVWSCVFLPE